MNIAIILSGGTGNRVGIEVPKQYLNVNGQAVIKYCMDTIFSCNDIDFVHVVADKKWYDVILESINPYYKDKFKGFSLPGYNRQLSIFNALCDIEKYASLEDKLIIHDAARPFVKKDTITELLNALNDFDGAIPVLPMKDTVYLVGDGRIESLLNRDSVKAGQAPEGFLFGKYIEANRKLIPDKINYINGSSEVAFLAGMSVKCIDGDEGNYKITTKEDLTRWQNESI